LSERWLLCSEPHQLREIVISLFFNQIMRMQWGIERHLVCFTL
jgi:hypothetical protein